jgi:hypothetical protein
MKHDVTHYGTWVSYSGAARVVLTVGLLAIAACVTLAGTLLPRLARTLPSPAIRPGRAVAAGLVTAWVLAIVAFGVGASLYVEQLRRVHLAQAPPDDPITPVTVIAVMITFIAIFLASPHRFWTRLLSAAVGAMAGPMIFELPFDLIVMTRTYPPIPPDPALYRAYFFAPLILTEITSLSLLALSPMVRLARSTFVAFALMLAVFAIWSVSGFGYPSSAGPITLNVISKILAFATALTLFLPQRARPIASDEAAAAPQAAPRYDAEPATE